MDNSTHTTRTTCCICVGEWGYQDDPKLQPFADLGTQPLADRFLATPDEPEPVFPLRVGFCPRCRLVQHMDIVDDQLLFGEDYAFFTGASPSSMVYFAEYAQDIKERYPNHAEGFVVEIAGNDGTLLKHFTATAQKTLNIEPASPPADFAREQGIPTLDKPFSFALAREVAKEHGRASLIMANNVVAHVADPLGFLSGVRGLLADDGVFVAEFQYLPHLLFPGAFDHLYHEHRSFFSLSAFEKACKRVQLQVVDVIEADTQGGSLRVFCRVLSSQKPSSAVTELLDRETRYGGLGLTRDDTLTGFQERTAYARDKLVTLLRELKSQGKTIYGFGASAKGNTLLNTCGIDTTLLDCIVDLTPYKIGKYAPGSKLPVKHPNEVALPDYYLLLVWNYLDGVLERETVFRKGGGRFIVPIPTPMII